VSLRFRFEPEAEEELLRAAEWYEERRSGLGTEFIAAIDATLDLIARWPDADTPSSRGPAGPTHFGTPLPIPRRVLENV
jgi:hypothetical protein